MASMYGFSIFQPSVGATLQWLPAIGTPELDDMIHSLIPGPASIQDKRAHVSMDFFEYTTQTGKNFRFYSVPNSFAAVSPASSFDAGYASSFNSPVVPDMAQWAQTPVSLTPSVSADELRPARTASKKPSVSSSRQQTADFSSHPGMRIMTKDGRDVTNSASRGCKTKEQRDHAHLMRIIKACDACKRKKIRCDPSHKKRTASQASASSQHEAKPAKKAKKAAESPPIAPIAVPDFDFLSFFGTPETPFSSFQSSPEIDEDLFDFDQFVQPEQEFAAAAPDFSLNSSADNCDFFNYSQSTSSSSASPSSQGSLEQWIAPATPAPPAPSPPVALSDPNAPQDFALPYLNPGVAHGTNYADFSLYSPAPDFFLDEEPLSPRKATASGVGQQQSSQPSHVEGARATQHSTSTEGTGVASSDGYHSSPSATSSRIRPQIFDIGRVDQFTQSQPFTVISPVDVGAGDLYDHHDEGYDGDGRMSGRGWGGPSQQSLSRSSGLGAGLGVEHVDRHHLDVAARGTAGMLFSHPCRRVFSSSAPELPSEPDRQAEHCSPTPAAGSSRSMSRRMLSSDSPQLSVASITAQPQRSALVPATTSASYSVLPTALDIASTIRQSAAGLSPTLVLSSVVSTPAGRIIVDERPDNATACSTLTTALVSTILPMWRDSVGGAFLPLATLGLVSSLFVFALQSQFMGIPVDHQVRPDVLIISLLYLVSLVHGRSRLGGESSKPTRPPSVGTINNVKIMVQAAGQTLDGVRCAFSRQLRTLTPQLPALTWVRV